MFTVGEQEFFAEKGFTNEPTRCPACRSARRNQVVWIRSANDADDLKAKETQVVESAEWKEASAHTRGMVARMEVQIIDPVID